MANQVFFVGHQRRDLPEAVRLLEANGFELNFCESAAELAERAVSDSVLIAVATQSSRELAELAAISPAELILFGDSGVALEAQADADIDYLANLDDPSAVLLCVRRAFRRRDLSRNLEAFKKTAIAAGGLGAIVGSSPRMLEMFDLIRRTASTDASVLITGESGTGKELVARELHRRSKRAARPFVAVNCSALPEALLESELFGHTKGAFTDAKISRPGLLVSAKGGTIFLDEIGDMPIGLQPKLLRVLQERAVRPVGSDSEISVDVRVVASTNVDLDAAVKSKAFRQDLFYRLNVVHLDVCPLRERIADIIPLAEAFVARYAASFGREVRGLSPAARDQLRAYSWPGNVRELENCVESAVTLARDVDITLDDLPPNVRNHRRRQPLVVSERPEELITLAELERRYIVQVMTTLGGNKKAAAQVLGIDRKTLYRKIRSAGL